MTSNKTLNGAFRKNSTLFRRYIMGEISRSTEYKKFEDRLDMILLLADRFLIAFETHIAFNQVQKVSENLYRVQASVDNSNGDEPKAVDDLLQSIEQWHKTLLWLVDRPAWDKLNKNKKSFTLFPCMRELGLLTQVELDTQPENISSISDPVRKLLYWVRRDRNTVTHDTYAEPSYDRRRYLHSTLLALIAPICKHQETIHKKLSGLIASSSVNDVEDIQRLIRLVDGERRNHYGRFVARKEWLEKILTELQPNTTESMHYLLLTGHEGLGKSALCAALATELAQKNIVQHNTDYFGAATGDVRKIAPWLPGVLLHFGKQSNHPHEIVQSLVSQANTLLLEPVVLPENRNDMDLMLDEQAFQPHTKPRPPAPPIQKSRANPQGFDFNTDTYMLPDYSVPHTPTLPTQFKPRTAGPDMEQYRRTVYLSLDKVAREYGPVVLIMDALDEISPDGTSLDFLPEHLPHGVSALLTARRNSHAVRWIKQNRHAKEITLKGLDRSEISLLTGIDDDESDEAAAFNQQVWKKSGGLPLFVQDVAQQIPEYRHNLGQMKIQQGSNSVFQRQAEAWNTNTLQQLLHLLTIFEPVSSLDMDTLQSFLEHQDLDLSSAELRHLLEPVHTQLEGLESGQLKLGLKAFAEYVRDRYCSKRDLARALEVVVTWLSTATDDISARTVASFLQFWTESSTVRDDRLRKAAAKLVDNLVEQRDAEFMYNVVRHARKVDVPKNKKSKRTSSKSLLPNFATRLLQSSAELEYVPATRRLGLNLLNGSGVRKDIVKGQEWLKRAILLDDTESKVHLGEFLLDKSQSELCGVEGEQLLQEAVIEGNEMAQFLLANRLLNGKGVTQDVGEGGALLRQSAEEGSIISAVMLAMRLIHGQGIAKNIDEGRTLLNDLWESGENGAGKILADYLTDKHNSDADIEWGRQILRTMVDAGDVEAMISLSNHLLDGTNPSVIQRQEGETLLHKAIEQQNERAVRIYGMRLLNGDGLQQNVEKGQKLLLDAATDGDVHSMIILSNHFFQEEQSKEGEKWLVKAANTGHGLAMRFLSLRLLSGDGLKKNTIKGIQWLRKAAKVGESVSMRILGVKLLNGDGLNQNSKEGEKWIRKAAEMNEPASMAILGIRLLEGDNLEQNLPEGQQWLYKAADTGLLAAMTALYLRLLDGDGLAQNLKEGEKWLRKAANADEPDAMAQLGLRLLNGDGLAQDLNEGEMWLRKAAEARETYSMAQLGLRLLDGDGLAQNLREGEKWLRKAADADEPLSMTELGERLLDGDGLAQDLKEGEKWLRKAAQSNESYPMRILGARLLDGDGVNQDIKEGEKWLCNAADAGAVQAMALLCDELMNGKLLKQNVAEAKQWLKQLIDAKGNERNNALVYVLRRMKTPIYAAVPKVREILQEEIQNKEPVPLINYALATASGYDAESDWINADDIVASLTTLNKVKKAAKDILDWWHKQAVLRNDPEGHLVVGWIVRHGLTIDPDGLSVAERMRYARDGGWEVPEWMDEIV